VSSLDGSIQAASPRTISSRRRARKGGAAWLELECGRSRGEAKAIEKQRGGDGGVGYISSVVSKNNASTQVKAKARVTFGEMSKFRWHDSERDER